MSPQTSPPEPTDNFSDRSTDAPLEVDEVGGGPATPSVPELVAVGGLLVVYLAALGMRRAVSWLRSAVDGRSR